MLPFTVIKSFTNIDVLGRREERRDIAYLQCASRDFLVFAMSLVEGTENSNMKHVRCKEGSGLRLRRQVKTKNMTEIK